MQIKLMLRQNNKTKKQIGKIFNVGESAISHIDKNRTWKHINI